MDKEEIKIKMDVGVDSLLASEGINLLFFFLFFFFYLWDAQPCLWNPE